MGRTNGTRHNRLQSWRNKGAGAALDASRKATGNEAAPRVLVVEDDPILATLIAQALSDSGFAVDILPDGDRVAAQVRRQPPLAVLLDLGLPGRDGFAVCRELRTFSTVPLIMVTARTDSLDRMRGLDIGADDYLCKPFEPGELVARLRALLRRAQQWQGTAATQPLHIDSASMQVSVHDVPLPLTPIEFRLLQTLAQHPGRVYSRAQLLDTIYNADHVVNDRTVDSHIKNLRRKLVVAGLEDPLGAVYGVGYRFLG
jgi:two-component system response regulator BaeR